MKIIRPLEALSTKKIQEFIGGWGWRHLQTIVPAGGRWVLDGGMPVLRFDHDDDSVVWVPEKMEASRFGWGIVDDMGEPYTLEEFAGKYRGWKNPLATLLRLRKADVAAFAVSTLHTRVKKEYIEIIEREPRGTGLVHRGVSVLYGVGWREALSLTIAMHKQGGRPVVVVPSTISSKANRGLAARLGQVEGGLVVFDGLPDGDIYSPEWWRQWGEVTLKPLQGNGWDILLTRCERYRKQNRRACENHLKGDPLSYTEFTIIHVSYPKKMRTMMEKAAQTIMTTSRYSSCEEVQEKAKETHESYSSSSLIKRVPARVKMGMAVTKGRGRRKAAAVEAKEEPAIGSISAPAVPAGIEEAVSPLDVLEVNLRPAGPDGDLPLLFSVEGPTGSLEDSFSMETPPPLEDDPVVLDEAGEVVVSERSTNEILARVWEVLSAKGTVAFDRGVLWVRCDDGAWVAAKDAKDRLRLRLSEDIRWTELVRGVGGLRRCPHFALLDLADLMVLRPLETLPARPAAREGVVRKITEMEPLVGKIVALDTETSGPGEDGALNPRLNRVELLQINDGTQTQLLTTRGCTADEITQGFRRIFDHADLIVGHNLSFDLPTIWAKTRLLPKAVFDTMIAAVLLRVANVKTYGGGILQGMGLKDTLLKYLNIEMDKEQQRSDWGAAEWTKEQLDYAAKDVLHLHRLMEVQVGLLNALDSGAKANVIGLKNRVARLEMAMVLVMVEPQVMGIPVNRAEIEREIGEAHQRELESHDAFLRKYPQVRNINSRPQVMAALSEDTEDGANLPDLQADTVAAFVSRPGVRMLHEYKTAAQVYRNLKRYREDTVFPGWLVIGGGAGRMASRDPGVQNVPKQIKPKFYSPTLTIVKADYPAIESRLAAVFTGEDRLIAAFNEGKDVHIQTASLVMHKPEAEITKQERQLAKALNYGLLYGVGAATFQASANSDYGLALTIEQASEFRDKFFEAYPALKQWHTNTAKALRSGKGLYTKTLYGRVMRQNQDDYTDSLNYPIQGSGADLLKLAAVKVWLDLQKFDGKARILNLVHDEIVVAVMDKAIKAQVAVVVRDAMEEAARKLMPEVKTPVDVVIVEATEGTLLDGV